MSFQLIQSPVVRINFTGASPDPNVSLSTPIYSLSKLVNTLTVALDLPSTYIISSTYIPSALTITVPLSTVMVGTSVFFGATHNYTGPLKIGVTLNPTNPTSYTKGAPRPIAYLKNDNDDVGSFSAEIDSSPSDYEFQ